MTKELELWQFIAGRLKKEHPVMLLIVADSSGSSPGRPGFKMAVASDDMFGSIGGGVMEVNLVKQARALLSVPPALAGGSTSGQISKGPKSGRNATVMERANPEKNFGENKQPRTFLSHQTHQKSSPTASGMICSGRQTVIFRNLGPDDTETVAAVIASLENRGSNILSISQKGIAINPTAADAQPYSFESRSETEFEYRERLGNKNDLYIIGGGHCALALSDLMSKMDFYIRIFDDRPELNTLSKNTFANEKHIIESYEQITGEIPGGDNGYVVVMTLGFASDEVVIRSLLDKNFKYFGVLGSKAKMAQLLRNLRNEGYEESRLKNIRTPIGLSINSQTPEEIAISIAAEIISVKNS